MYGQIGVLEELEEKVCSPEPVEKCNVKPREYKYVWRNIILYIYLHAASFYGLYLVFTSAKIATSIHAWFLIQLGVLGLTCGAHRLWSHRTYKAKLPLKILLIVLQTMTFQGSVIDWARDHRVHHKFSETDADPHNATRGFFYAHIGWLLTRRHPDVIEKGKCVDLSDLTKEPVLHFQKKYYLYLMPLAAFIVPTAVPMYFWNESFVNALTLNLLRYCITLNITWLINSAAHRWGQKPYDKFINPSENLGVALLTLGEGWHNYHHIFPWDYRTSELGKYGTNVSTIFLDIMAKIGWAYDLKSVSEELIKKRIKRTGDGSHKLSVPHRY